MDNLNILITGGAGFIGSNIVEYLCKNKLYKKIRIVDNLSTGNKNNIKNFLEDYENIEFIYGDISNLELCRNVVKDMNVICHQAALGSVPRSVNDPLSSHISNVNGFLNILLSAKEEGIKRIVYASSSSVYGDHPILPKVEENLGNVLSPYAATKKIDEIYANVFTKCYDMECIGLRYFNIFGPRQDPNGPYAAVIPKFISLMEEGKSPIINGDGTFSRDFTYVENAVQSNILAMTIKNKKCYGENFNIGCGGQYNLNELIDILNRTLNLNIKPIYGPNRPGDIPHSNADITKAITMLGYKVKIDFKNGIEHLISYNKKKLYEIDYSKLLNREEIKIKDNINIEYLQDKKILVFGGFGSIGSEIVNQLLNLNVKIIVYDNNECNYFYFKNLWKEYENKINFVLGDIRDNKKLETIFSRYNIDIVYSVAAYKHVPILEDNEYESIMVNIYGIKKTADLSLKYKIKKYIFVSTDKAVNPTNIMGCCKRISELYMNYLWNKYKKTEFITTRFGNVLGSSGSLIPTILNCIEQNKNIELTHKDITRYFMSISEASKLVILSSCICKNNEKVLFDMGEPIKISDLIHNLLKLLNKTNTKINITGLRKGEKLYEDLYYQKEKIRKTDIEKIFLLETEEIDLENFIDKYNDLISINPDLNGYKIRKKLKNIVSEYNYTYN